MSLSMNERAAGLVEAMAADADALGVEVRTLAAGARLVDCGAESRGGMMAGVLFAGACMGGLGRIEPVPVTVGERTWPGVAVGVDQPAAACLASQYAGWKLEHDDFFAMASGVTATPVPSRTRSQAMVACIGSHAGVLQSPPAFSARSRSLGRLRYVATQASVRL